jgi:hypothetical protein
MFGLELTTGEKVQIGVVVAILALAGFMFFRNTRVVPDNAVNAWVEIRKYQVDPSKPMSRDNPADPKKEATITVFACYDGKLEIREFTKDPTRKPSIAWREIDKRRKTYIYYKDPLLPVKAVTDPYKHAMALASYNVANGRKLGLMNNAGLTKEQLEQEAAARKAMLDSLAVTKMQVDDGSFRMDLLKPVMAALQAYRNMSGDPMKDAKKADAARKVLELASQYLDVVDRDRQEDVEKYIATMTKILSKEQKDIIAKAGQDYEKVGMRLAAGPSARPPATPGAVNTNRAAGQNRAGAAPANRSGTAPQNRAAPARQGTAVPVRNVETVTG